ncbi:MAG: hypothetical protein LBE08_09520 [Bifidobacteriaceae bacterium]|jgi:hypothetical protein|nr:hypothetical protein [Bifidobacteriaceae bacterium]
MTAGRIRLGVLERSPELAESLSDALLEFYPDELSLSLLAGPEQALAWAGRGAPGVLLVDQERVGDLAPMPSGVVVAALVDGDERESGGVPALSRYLAVDALFAELTKLSGPPVGAAGAGPVGGGAASVVVAFTSPQGGVGTTAAAVAFARKLAGQEAVRGAKVLYFDATPFASAGQLLCGRGGGTMSDVAAAVKARSGSLPVALRAAASQDESSGLYYYAAARSAADVMDLTSLDLIYLYDTVFNAGVFGYVVADIPFAWAGAHGWALAAADLVVGVTDGHAAANRKLARAVEALGARAAADAGAAAGAEGDWNVQAVFYNQYTSSSSKVKLPDVSEAGSAPRLSGLGDVQVVVQLGRSHAFDALLEQVISRA